MAQVATIGPQGNEILTGHRDQTSVAGHDLAGTFDVVRRALKRSSDGAAIGYCTAHTGDADSLAADNSNRVRRLGQHQLCGPGLHRFSVMPRRAVSTNGFF